MERQSERNLDQNDVRDAVRKMITELGWEKHHTPRNLVVSILLEASELLQKIQWKTDEQTAETFSDLSSRPELLYELADININLVSLCDQLKIDLNRITIDKCDVIARRFRDRDGLSRGSSRIELSCTKCARAIAGHWQYCANCGAALVANSAADE